MNQALRREILACLTDVDELILARMGRHRYVGRRCDGCDRIADLAYVLRGALWRLSASIDATDWSGGSVAGSTVNGSISETARQVASLARQFVGSYALRSCHAERSGDFEGFASLVSQVVPALESLERAWLGGNVTEASGSAGEAGRGDDQDAAHPILLVDDDEATQLLLQRHLESWGYACEVAGNGLDALALWRAGGFGLVMTDIHMPVVDGYDLALAIRSESGHSGRQRIIALTSDANFAHDSRHALGAIDEFLVKPVRAERLRQVVERHARPSDVRVAGRWRE